MTDFEKVRKLYDEIGIPYRIEGFSDYKRKNIVFCSMRGVYASSKNKTYMHFTDDEKYFSTTLIDEA